MLSEKENFMRALSGQVPEYVPLYNIVWNVRPALLHGGRDRKRGGVGKDIFGVEWTNEGSAFEAAIQVPNNYLLDDIRRWRDVIKVPSFSDADWEKSAAADSNLHDPKWPMGGTPAAQGFFQSVISFMGFAEGLVACYEEPDEVKELVNYLCDFYLSYADKYLQYYKPDYIWFGDDIAHERNPFVSLELFREIFAPVWRRFIKFFKDRGYLAVHHNCGHFEAFLDDLVDMGFNAWDPAQISNDLVGIKKKFGNRLMICGGLELSRRFPLATEITEQDVRGTVKKLFDDLAPGGGYGFLGGGPGNNPVEQQHSDWINDEFNRLRATYYV